MVSATAKCSLVALWLDDEQRLERTDEQALARAGLVLRYPQRGTLSDHSIPAEIDVLVLRLRSHEVPRQGLQRWGMSTLPSCPVIARVPDRDIRAAVNALQSGASYALSAEDFAVASWDEAAGPIARSRQEPAYVFVDPVSQRLLALAERVALTPVSVLLDGPTGAGKDVLARIIHEASARSGNSFVAFSCAALPEHLIEDALFGHDRGAFTGAVRDHPGLFEQAQSGTLFLDEIGDMPLHLQAKLLRVLQERQCVRLGSTRTIELDVRIVAATHRNLPEAIEEGAFREDLFFRLSTFRLTVPPLAERPGDILPLARCLLAEHAPADAPELSKQAAAALTTHPWPGNVRELQNVMQRALVMCDGRRIEVNDLVFDQFGQGSGFSEKHNDEAAGVFERSRDAWEVETLSTVLALSSSRNEAARRLGISPRTLRYRLARLRERGLQVTA